MAKNPAFTEYANVQVSIEHLSVVKSTQFSYLGELVVQLVPLVDDGGSSRGTLLRA